MNTTTTHTQPQLPQQQLPPGSNFSDAFWVNDNLIFFFEKKKSQAMLTYHFIDRTVKIKVSKLL